VALKKSDLVKKPIIKINNAKKPVILDMKSEMPSSPVAETEEASEPPDLAFYADNKIPRDYSNQPDADLSQDPVQVVAGSPYVPSVSLAYDAQPVIIAADSVQKMLINNDIRAIASLSNLKAIANLKELEIQIDKNKQELTRIEIENQKIFMPDQKNVKPLIKKLQKQIDHKKIQIGVLRSKLQVSEAEIIHI
jgi:hypothetical protein